MTIMARMADGGGRGGRGVCEGDGDVDADGDYDADGEVGDGARVILIMSMMLKA